MFGLDNVGGFGAVIGGFATSDTIDLGNLVYSSTATRSFTEAASHTSGTLIIKSGASSGATDAAGKLHIGQLRAERRYRRRHEREVCLSLVGIQRARCVSKRIFCLCSAAGALDPKRFL